MDPRRLLDALVRARARSALASDAPGALRAYVDEVVALCESEAGALVEVGANAAPLRGLAAASVETGAAVIRNDLEPDSDAGFDFGVPTARCVLALPLRSEGRLVGALGLANRAHGYDARFAASIEPFAACLADAIALQRRARESERADAALRRRLDIDALVLELSHEFLALPAERVDGAIEAALLRVARFTGADRAALDLVAADGKHLLRTHAAGVDLPPRVPGIEIATHDLPEWAIRFALAVSGASGAGSAARAALPADSPVYATLTALGVEHVAWLIARVDGEPVGAVVMSWLGAPFAIDPADLHALALVADILTAAERRKRADLALRASEQRFRTLADAAPLLVWECDAEGRLRFLNRFGVEFAGRPFEEVAGRPLAAPVHPDDLGRLTAAFVAARDERRPFEVEFRSWRGDGQLRSLLMCGGPVLGPEGALRGFVGSSLDVTDRKRLEEELAHAQKLEAVGRLAGGIAHDFNNLLTAVLGHADCARAALRGGASPAADLDEIDAAATRAAALTRQLLAFASRQPIAPRVVDASELVAGVEKLLRRLLGEHVLLEVALDPGAGSVRVDPGQLEQVLINLAVNARDAMPMGGSLRIETSRAAADAAPETGAAAAWVRIAVRDTGTGMDEATLARAFEPFFTTKQLGQGTGLGLATCYGIVRQSDGHITAKSEVGVGSTFEILLPLVEPARARAAEPARAAAVPALAQETILVVEDEASVREVMARRLRADGYRVLEAVDGVAAEEVLQSEAVDLLVTDVVMPRRSGPELATWARRRQPGLRVLFVSGYTASLTRELGPGQWFLPKPFQLHALAARVRQALDAALPERAGDARGV